MLVRMSSIFDDPAFLATLFFPRSDSAPCPEGARDRFAIDEGGTRIHFRVHPVDQPAVTVLFFHGNGEIVSDYDDLASSWQGLGAEFIVAEFRGYGKSTDTPTLFDLLTDAHLVLDEIDAGERPLIVMGRSLGSIPAVELASSRPEIDGLIVESGMADPSGLVTRRGIRLDAAGEEDLVRFDNAGKVSRTDLPLLVLHGANDMLISPHEGAALHAASPSRRKELVVLPGAGHNDILLAPGYFEAVEEFLAGFAG